MKKKILSVILAVLTAFCAFFVTACDENDDGPVDLAGKKVYFHFQKMDIDWDAVAYEHFYQDPDDGYKSYSVTLTMKEFVERFVGSEYFNELFYVYKDLYENGATEYNLNTLEGTKNVVKNAAVGRIGESNPYIVFYSDASAATAYRYGDTNLREPLANYTVQKDGEIVYNLYDKENQLVGSLHPHEKDKILVLGSIFPTTIRMELLTTDVYKIELTAADGSTIERSMRFGIFTATLKCVEGNFSLYKVDKT